jgi:arginyl-tRNA synthetase
MTIQQHVDVDHRAILRSIREQGGEYGRCDLGRGESVQVEFVSANPTGPLGLDHGRGGVLGDATASLLAFAGYRVTREFYVNDAGSQVERFGASVEACFLQLLGQDVPVPEDGYHAPYVREIAERIRAREGDAIADLPGAERRSRFTALACEEMRREQQETLARFGVRFDVWFRESDLHRAGKVEEILRLLTEGGHTYEADGALWLRSTAFGDESDRPVRRSNGQPTYVAGDLAYHLEKFHRGFDRVIDVWAADHDNYVARAKAGFAALNHGADRVEILIYQPVRLFVDGTPRVGSRRAAEIVPLDDLLTEIGADAARYLLLSVPADEPLDLDLDLARRGRDPFHAVRTLEARLAALRAAQPSRAATHVVDATRGATNAAGADPARLPGSVVADPGALPLAPSAERLLATLAVFPEEVCRAVVTLDPTRLTRFADRLVADFTAFDRQPAVSREPAVADARFELVDACHVVLSNLLRLLGVASSAAASS